MPAGLKKGVPKRIVDRPIVSARIAEITEELKKYPALLKDTIISEFSGIPTPTLRKARCGAIRRAGDFPPFRVISGRVFYPKVLFIRWLANLELEEVES